MYSARELLLRLYLAAAAFLLILVLNIWEQHTAPVAAHIPDDSKRVHDIGEFATLLNAISRHAEFQALALRCSFLNDAQRHTVERVLAAEQEHFMLHPWAKNSDATVATIVAAGERAAKNDDCRGAKERHQEILEEIGRLDDAAAEFRFQRWASALQTRAVYARVARTCALVEPLILTGLDRVAADYRAAAIDAARTDGLRQHFNVVAADVAKLPLDCERLRTGFLWYFGKNTDQTIIHRQRNYGALLSAQHLAERCAGVSSDIVAATRVDVARARYSVERYVDSAKGRSWFRTVERQSLEAAAQASCDGDIAGTVAAIRSANPAD